MYRTRSWVVSGMLALAMCVAAPACNDSKGYTEPSSSLRIISVTGPKDDIVTYDPKSNSGACPLAVDVAFRLPEDQFVWKAYVRFQGDGDTNGVDRGYLLEQTYGAGSEKDVNVRVNTSVPPSILRPNALYTYSVRLVTGTGDESPPSTLTVTVQPTPEE